MSVGDRPQGSEPAPYFVVLRGLDAHDCERVVYGCGPDEPSAIEDAWTKAPRGYRVTSFAGHRPGP